MIPSGSKFRIIKQQLLTGLVGLFLAMQGLSQTVTYYQTGEEFVGPLGGWKNVKTDYGAKGDGVTDDAAAINTALVALKSTATNSYTTLYFPAGTYQINATVATSGRTLGDDYSGIDIIGEDPATTVIAWNGADNGTMMAIDGWNMKVSRLAFDGKRKAAVGISHTGAFGTGTEMSDLAFTDITGGTQAAALGAINLGYNGQGQAEHLVIRCKFVRCKTAICMPNMNSLDIWTWYCLFQDCGKAFDQAGGYQAYCNVFLRSTVHDFSETSQPGAIVNNISIGSKRFFGGSIKWDYGFYQQLFLMGNKVYNSDTAQIAMRDLVMLDNTWRSRDGSPYTFKFSSLDDTGGIHKEAMFFMGNTFSTTANFMLTDVASRFNTISIDNKFVDPATLTVPGTVELPATPPKVDRKIFEVSIATDIQSQIVAACNEPAGSKPVVHIKKGSYTVNSTITVPSNKEISIVGDGSGGFGTSVNGEIMVIRLLAPSRVTIQDIDFRGNPGVYVEVLDKPGSRVIGRMFNAQGQDGARLAAQALVVDSIERGDLLFMGAGIQRCQTGVVVRGGTNLNVGIVPEGQIAFLSGAHSQARGLWDVRNGGRLIAHGFWHEADITSTKHMLELSSLSKGSISLAAMFWCHQAPDNIIVSIDNFNGSYTSIIGRYLRYGAPMTERITGSSTNCNVLDVNPNFYDGGTLAQNWADQTTPAASAGMIGLTNVFKKTENTVPDDQFIRNQLAHMRSLRLDKPVACPAGVNDVKLLRVVASSNAGIGARFVGKVCTDCPAVGIADHRNTALNVSSPHNRIQRLLPVGAIVNLPSATTGITVYDMQGRTLIDRIVTPEQDVRSIAKSIQKMGRCSMLLVKMQFDKVNKN